MPAIDLDAAKAARKEALKDAETPTVVFGGESFDLPFEMPFGVFMRLGEMKNDPDKAMENMRWLVDTLFEAQADDFLKQNPSFDDVLYLVDALFDSYEVDLPEASASPSQS